MTARAVLQGQLATFETTGAPGWHRRPCPSDGVLIESDEVTAHVGVDELRPLLLELGYELVKTKRVRK